ncbi:bacteriohemerythrin [Paramagnetospirillum magneticum]|uniref:Hemerythrin-like protein MJ0747 n=1 Tax=Paramagnetospirillum magneticum (strain ATCC 700264 / AMB-1) TaxID=342108 RepID=Q2W2N0_PARM1|nr:hemerythrin family protein [Paramagnetospirillum magneticum]BAE51895.1 Hemerythrin-like protein MJ0747 [Paramagnetospirillum magneticum AMB-1]
MATSYTIGHKPLDDDHDRMIAAWRELEGSRTLEAAKAAAAVLMAEAGEHFAREEMFMLQCGYPDRVRHMALHAEMASGLRRVLLSPLMGGSPHDDFVLAVRSLMDKWVMVHILGEDAKLAPYARAHAAHAAHGLAVNGRRAAAGARL